MEPAHLSLSILDLSLVPVQPVISPGPGSKAESGSAGPGSDQRFDLILAGSNIYSTDPCPRHNNDPSCAAAASKLGLQQLEEPEAAQLGSDVWGLEMSSKKVPEDLEPGLMHVNYPSFIRSLDPF